MSPLRRLDIDMAGVLGTTGITLLVIGVAQLLPAAVAFWGGAPGVPLLLGALGTTSLGASLIPLRRQARKWTRRESIGIVVLSWVGAILASAVPFLVTGAAGPWDALFESTSGITTTGSTIYPDVDRLATAPGLEGPHPGTVAALHLWRALTHWLGGAGVVLVVVMLTPFLDDVEALRRTQRSEASFLTERYRGSTRATMKGLLTIYVGATLLCWVALAALGMSVWDALLHALATLATGGYSNKTASLGAWGAAVQLATAVFMVVASLNFALLGRIVEEVRAEVRRRAKAAGRWRAARDALRLGPTVAARLLWRNGEARGYLLLLAASSLLVAAILIGSEHPHARYEGLAGAWQGLVDAVFYVTSISSTTGYGTVDYTGWPVSCQVVLFGLMVTGGCTGSTAGGIKLRRAMILAKYIRREVVRYAHPRAVVPIRLGDTVVPEEHVREALGFCAIYAVVVLALALVVGLSGEDTVTTAGATLSTVGSVGPGFGEVGPHGSFQGLAPWVKVALCLGMLLGRLEFFPVLTALAPSFWLRRGSAPQAAKPPAA